MGPQGPTGPRASKVFRALLLDHKAKRVTLVQLDHKAKLAYKGYKAKGAKKGDNSSLVVPSYANFLNTAQQTILFDTMQTGFVSFNSTPISQGITLQNGTDIIVGDAGVYKLNFSFSINNFYNSSNLRLFVNDSSLATLLSSFANGNYATSRIIRLQANDIIKVGATATRLVLNGGLSLTIFKIDK